MRALLTPLRLIQTALGLTLVASTMGCQDYLNQVAVQYPALAPYVGGRPKPAPFAIKTGNIRGFVYGAEGVNHPVPLAFVTTGSISSFTGNPSEADVVDQEADDGKTINVMHDFTDGKGNVLAERRLRKKPGGPDPFDKYVYLRKGEFFLEELPEGISTISSSFGNVTSPATPVTVYGGVTVTDVALSLFIPTPVENEDHSTPHIIEWTGIKPETGVTVSVQRKETTTPAGGTNVDISITYKPDPPDVSVELKAPPGSGGTVIREVELTYVWTTPANQAAGKPPSQLGPIRYPISPINIAPAQATSFGRATILTIPVGSSSLQSIFKGNVEDQPGLVIAKMQFIGEDGFAVQGKSLEALEVSTVLRSL